MSGRRDHSEPPRAVPSGPCPVCGAETDWEPYSIREMMFGSREAFDYGRCRSCGSIVIARVPPDLGRHYPDRKDKVLNRIRDLRGGKLNDSNFHTRMVGQGPWSEQLKSLFDVAKRKAGLDRPFPELSTQHFKAPAGPQMTLFE